MGWELGINYNGHAGKDLTYGINFNISDVKNKILDLKEFSASNFLQNREGYSIGSIYALEADGYFQSQDEINNHPAQVVCWRPAILRYVNQNKDNNINNDDYKIIGSTIPRYTYGLNLNAGVQRVSALMPFYRAWAKPMVICIPMPFSHFIVAVRHMNNIRITGRPKTPTHKFPRLTYNDGGNNYLPSSFWMKNAAYLRLKNIQLGYSLPLSLIKQMGHERGESICGRTKPVDPRQILERI